MKSSLFRSLFFLSAVVGAPTSVTENGVHTVSSSVFNSLFTGANFAAAAYCNKNVNSGSTPRPISCSGTGTNICPAAKGAMITASFKEHVAIGYVAKSGSDVIISFQGTENVDQLIDNIKFFQDPVEDICPGCRVHKGFHEAWKSVKTQVLKDVTSALSSSTKSEILVVGHSLGAAIAALAAIDIKKAHRSNDVSLFSYGSPREGEKNFANYYTSNKVGLKKVFRVTHFQDQVPRIPKPDFIANPNVDGQWQHFGPEYYITHDTLPQTANEISVFAKGEDQGGNAGPKGQNYTTTNIRNEHQEYLTRISGNTGC